MPTGGGKSLCYQVPALLLPGLTLVVSPLIALMSDQVNALERRDIPAALINSTLTGAEIRARLRQAVAGQLELLYVAPERFASPAFLGALREMRVGLVAIDEAHCVCEWGHDFRPSYLRLREFWPRLGWPPLLALTATATPEARQDIVRELDLRGARVIVRGFDRPNLRWTVCREERLAEKGRQLVELLGPGDGTALVYCATRKMAEAATELLRGAGVDAAAYHAGLRREGRARVQAAWTRGELRVVVATNAFGMGIDKADVRCVVHLQMPGSLEAYYQEAGRAGRDGGPADCVLLHSYGDRFIHEFFIRAAHPPRPLVSATYQALCAAVEAFGGPVGASRIAPGVPGVKSQREVESALRILVEAGAVEDTVARRDWVVRWIAGREALAALADGGVREPELERLGPLLAGLAAASQGGARRVFRVSRREAARWVGGEVGAAAAGLDALQAAGLLGWRDAGRRPGYEPRDRRSKPDALPVDWERLEARRRMELRKLKRMEGYAYGRGCRRRYLLRYFGEAPGRRRCGGCDRCGGGDPQG